MKIYISGPMTGIDDYNRPAFFDAERRLKDAGYMVINPVINGVKQDADWQTHMRADIKMLMDADGVALLENYSQSKGAMIEMRLASGLGIVCKSLKDWTNEP